MFEGRRSSPPERRLRSKKRPFVRASIRTESAHFPAVHNLLHSTPIHAFYVRDALFPLLLTPSHLANVRKATQDGS